MRVNPAQAIPIPIHDNRDEAATQGKLKKQSQFVRGRIGVNYYSKGNYDNMVACVAQKTNPIQSQTKPILCFNECAIT